MRVLWDLPQGGRATDDFGAATAAEAARARARGRGRGARGAHVDERTPCMRNSNLDHARPDAAAAKGGEHGFGASADAAHKKSGKFAGTTTQRVRLANAEAKGAARSRRSPTTRAPCPPRRTCSPRSPSSATSGRREERPNVTPDGRPVRGMCLGLVFVLGGGGMCVSNVSEHAPTLTRLVTRWVAGTLPEAFPFSSLQINYNYRAKRHVDGNNIGPSYIRAIGAHVGGGLWTADRFVHGVDEADGVTPVVRGGGGEAVLECKGAWQLFNGNAEHETRPYGGKAPGDGGGTRISFIAFSHHAYNKLPASTADGLKALGFTAGSTDGVDLPYYRRYRIDKKEFDADENVKYFRYQIARAKALPPPTAPNRVTIECYGLTMARGGGWMAFCGAPHGAAGSAAAAAAGAAARGAVDRRVHAQHDGLPRARALGRDVGARRAQARRRRQGGQGRGRRPRPPGAAAEAAPPAARPDELALASSHTDRARFNIYGKTDQEVARFAKWVKQLPRGRIVCICITDTAVAAKRPPGAQLYEALGELGAPSAMEKIGYRFPFAMLGAKGLPRGEAIVLMDKTKFLLRIDATVARGKDGAVTFEDVRTEKTDITTKVILSDGV